MTTHLETLSTCQDPNFAVMSALFGSVLGGDFTPNTALPKDKHNLGLLAIAALQKGSVGYSARIPLRPEGLIDGMDFMYFPSWAPNVRTFTIIGGRPLGKDKDGYAATPISGILLRPDFGERRRTLAVQENRVSPALTYLDILGNNGVISQTPLTLENAPLIRQEVSQRAEKLFQNHGHYL